MIRIARLVILSAIFGALSFGDISQANIWVNTSAGGSPSRSGSLVAYDASHAYGSMQAALTAAQAGDLIGVKNGTYGSQSITSGGKASAVSFYAETSSSVLVGGLTVNVDYVNTYGIIATGTGNSQGSLSLSGNHLIIDGFKGGRVAMGWSPHTASNRESYVTIQNSELCGNMDTALMSGENDCIEIGYIDYLTFKHNYIHDYYNHSGSNDTTYHNDLISFIFDGGAYDATFTGNTFVNWPNGGSAIQSSGPQRNLVLENNYFGGQAGGGQCGNNVVYEVGTCAGALTVRNNVFTNACGAMVNTIDCSAPSPIDVSSNISISPSTYAFCVNPVGTATGGYNAFANAGAGNNCGSNNRTCTPTWLNGTPSSANNWDIRLASTDTCAIGHGNPSSYAATDMYGTTRPQGAVADAGAYEYASGSATIPVITSPLTINPATRGSAYSYSFAATGSPTPTWTATGVPTGLTLFSGGSLTGTPTVFGTFSMHVTATNSAGSDADDFSITIGAGVPIVGIKGSKIQGARLPGPQ